MEKNIAFLIPSLRNGGAERVLSNMSINFDEKINQYIVVWDGKNIDYPYNGRIVDLNIHNKKSILSNIGVLIKRVSVVKKLKKENNIDTTISLLEGPNIVNIFSRKKDKVIVSVHNFQSKEREGNIGKIFKLLIKNFYNKSDIIVSVSEEIKKDLIDNFNLDKDKIKVIYNPFDIKSIEDMMREEIEEEYKHIFENPVVINAGRLTNQKGQWHLLKSFAMVKESIPNCKLVILGQGELEVSLKKLSKNLGIKEDVFFLGFQNNPFKFIHRADVFALTSLYEGFPMCLTEAMICETAVISVDCESGPREVLYKNPDFTKRANEIEFADYGVISCPFGEEISFENVINKEEKKFAEGIVDLLSNEDLKTRYKIKARERAINFDAKQILKQWEELL